MGQILAISEGAAIAIHTVILLAAHQDELLTTHFMAEELKVSENHCSKVMQRLNRAGLVDAIRGPKGGFKLNRNPQTITLLEIYNVIEGELQNKHCLFKVDKCPVEKCLFHNLTSKVNDMVYDFLNNNTVYDVINGKHIK